MALRHALHTKQAFMEELSAFNQIIVHKEIPFQAIEKNKQLYAGIIEHWTELEEIIEKYEEKSQKKESVEDYIPEDEKKNP